MFRLQCSTYCLFYYVCSVSHCCVAVHYCWEFVLKNRSTLSAHEDCVTKCTLPAYSSTPTLLSCSPPLDGSCGYYFPYLWRINAFSWMLPNPFCFWSPLQGNFFISLFILAAFQNQNNLKVGYIWFKSLHGLIAHISNICFVNLPLFSTANKLFKVFV